MSGYCARSHLLTGIIPTVYQSGTGHALPGMSFGYNNPATEHRTNYYEDTSNQPYGSTDYKVQTNWRSLISYHDHSNGVGAKIVYHTAYNNSHGTPVVSGDNRYDPFFCVWNSGSCGSSPFKPMYDKMWTQQVVYQITSVGKDSSASALTPATTTYHYRLATTTGTCPADSAGTTACVGLGWIPTTSDGWQDFYHGEFRGFGEVDITSPAGDQTTDKYYATEGWNSSQSDAANYLAGHPYEEDIYQGSTGADNTLLKQTLSTYAGTNSTSTSCSSAYVAGYYKPCEVIPLTTKTILFEGTGSGNTNAPWTQQSNTYDDYSSSSGLVSGTYHNLTKEVTTSSNALTVTKNMSYATQNQTVSGWTYYTVHNLAHSEVVDASGHTWQCQDTAYDEGASTRPGAGWPTTKTTFSTCGTASTAIKTYTGYDAAGNVVANVDGLEASNPSVFGSKGCTLTTVPTIFPTSSWSGTHYTSCTAYSASSALPTDTWNALGQRTQTSYDATQGLLPTSKTDVNSQVTAMSYSYDSSGNPIIGTKLPGETGSYTKQGTIKSTCTDSSTLPCFEVDSNTSLYAGAVKRVFYDTLGRKVETLSSGPDATHTTVTYTVYNDATHSQLDSLPFVVASRNTWLDPNGAASGGGTATVLDALGRKLSVTDPLSQQMNMAYSVGTSGVSGDSHTYATTTTIDANQHVQTNVLDALKRMISSVENSGKQGGTLIANRRVTSQYTALDKVTSVAVTDLVPQAGQSVTSATTTTQYDDLGRVITLADPDRGTHAYSYDADAHQLTDISGTRTIGASYDLLGRIGCVQDATPTTDGSGSCSSGSHPLIQNTYDSSVLGTASTDFPLGQLTQSLATTYYDPADATNKVTTQQQYQHDFRGRQITATLQVTTPTVWGVTSALPTYQQTQSYNNADQQVTTQTTMGGTSGYTFTQIYDGTTGQVTGLSNTTASTANLATQSYDAQGQVSDVNFQTTTGTALANEHFTYDGTLRPASTTAVWQSGSGSSGTIFSNSRTFDAVGNVTSTNTTQSPVPGKSGSGGNETQNFCYNEQNQLVWAGNAGTQPGAGNGTCGSATLASTISGASYNNAYAYTHLDQLWQASLNGSGAAQQYLYCTGSHPHQLTGLYPAGTACASLSGATYSSGYDAWGNVTSRITGGSSAVLTYDVQDRLATWNAGSSSQEWYAYDASGNRVLHRSITGSGTSLTTYAFGLEEHAYSATGTNTGNTCYYSLGGRLIGMASGTGTLTTQFSLTDPLGSVVATFNATAGSATLQGNQVYGPYGNQRYTSGSMGTNRGFTGQYGDASGLDYYNARYYDPVIGLFISADTKEGNSQGLDPYAYVGDDPETKNDPTGHDSYDPGMYYVGAWYNFLHEGHLVQLGDFNFPIPNSAVPPGDYKNYPAYYQRGYGKFGIPDIRNYSMNVIWEVKTGGGDQAGYDPFTHSGQGSAFPYPSTEAKGQAQAMYYAARLNYLAGRSNVWKIGSLARDPIVNATLDQCGGTCTVGFLDGMNIAIYSPMAGVLSYRYVTMQAPTPQGQPLWLTSVVTQG